MVHQRLLLAGGALLLFATACSVSPAANFTETAPAFLPATAQPTTPIETGVTDTVLPFTSTTLIDTPSASPTEPSMLISTVPPEIVGEHRVVSGETLSCIGRGYGVLPKAIADANGIDVTTVLNAGQVLKIPRVPWTNMPAGVTCSPQFSPPFPTSSVPNPPATTQAPSPTWTSTRTEDVPAPPATTETPSPTWTSTKDIVPTATPTTPTVNIPPTDTPSLPPAPVTSTPATIHVPPTDTPTFNPSPVGPGADTPMPPIPFPSLIVVTLFP